MEEKIEEVMEEQRLLESQMALFNVKLVEIDLRLQVLEATTTYDNNFLWKIPNYLRHKMDAVSGHMLSLYSAPFYTSKYGYKMCARAYLNGDGLGKGTHIGLYITLMKGDYDALLGWPFKNRIKFKILDQGTRRRHIQASFRPDPDSASVQRPVSEMNVSTGFPLFAQQNVIEGPGSHYLREDAIFVKVIVDNKQTANVGENPVRRFLCIL